MGFVGRFPTEERRAMKQTAAQNDATARTARLYRMVMPDHLCPFGLKARDLLERRGFTVEDHPLQSREETEAFMAEQGVETTPQVFIGAKRIGGWDDLRRHFGQHVAEEGETS
jgi:glutaredoxin